MKNQLTLTLFALLLAFSSFAQEFELPKKGAKIFVENATIEVVEKGETTFDLYLIKSRAARKANFENPKFIGPKGVEFVVSQDVADLRRYTVKVNANEIPVGDYSVTVTGKRSGIHAVTGKILSLKVNASNPIASKEGE